MDLLTALVLGIVQGLTEFIPVSSSGHLILVNELFGLDSNLTFDVALHIGTLMAVLVVFGSDFANMAKSLTRPKPDRLPVLLAAATVPAVIAGVWLQDAAETVFRSPALVAANLILVGIVMLMVDRAAGLKDGLGRLRLSQAMWIGAAQALALVPGVSRSGSTITAGLAVGLDRVAATRFSFMLSAPIILGAITKVLIDGGAAQLAGSPAVFVLGIVVSFASGYWAIRFLLRYLSRYGIGLFAYYRIGLGLLVLVSVAIG